MCSGGVHHQFKAGASKSVADKEVEATAAMWRVRHPIDRDGRVGAPPCGQLSHLQYALPLPLNDHQPFSGASAELEKVSMFLVGYGPLRLGGYQGHATWLRLSTDVALKLSVTVPGESSVACGISFTSQRR